ncbi:unnamed protein product [Anisakis simplex]|uniref:snRNA-activating protein complex subunit 4 (inferred by orthology to a human protein) n=1 Tax=Anisakis simplex TaxID=6269 RepID=A0A158PPI3_ANISI|nr:unnamed protein product [Anisakis simplex]
MFTNPKCGSAATETPDMASERSLEDAEGQNTSNYMELPPLVEDDDEGIGIMVYNADEHSVQFDNNIPSTSTFGIHQGATSGNSFDRNLLIRTLEAKGHYEFALLRIISRVEHAIRANQTQQKLVEMELKRIQHEDDTLRDNKKVPLQLFFPPYFKDLHDMVDLFVPSVNSEAKRRSVDNVYNLLVREEKKWTPTELNKLHVAVLKSVMEKKIESFVAKRECVLEKLRKSGQETSTDEKEQWRKRVEHLNRSIHYHLSLPKEEILACDKNDYSDVDWLKISNVDFLCTRTAKQIRLKWVNEQSPRWSKSAWLRKEFKFLQSLNKEYSIDWNTVASQMNTRRTPFQCIQKYKSSIVPLLYSKPWSKAEDNKLLILVKALKTNSIIPWIVVSTFFDNRSQYEIRNRYEQFSLPGRTYGKWNMAEDVALLCAVGRYGNQDWTSVANMIGSRSRTQCRERWVNMFNNRISDKPWTLDEDEQLLEGIKKFGKGEFYRWILINRLKLLRFYFASVCSAVIYLVISSGKWSQICVMIPQRSANDCKMRFRSLINSKLKILTDPCGQASFRSDAILSRRKRRSEVGKYFTKLVNFWRGGDQEESIVREPKQEVCDDEEDGLNEPVVATTKSGSNKGCDTDGADSIKNRMKLLNQLQITSDMLDETTLSIVRRYCGDESLLSCCKRAQLLDEEEQFRFNSWIDQLEDDQAKKSFIVDSLLDLIPRCDQRQSNKQDILDRLRIHYEVYDYFDKQLIEVVLNHLEEGTTPTPLTPCMGTMTILDEIKMKLRSLLFWPMLMDRAVESETSWKMRLTQNGLREEKIKEYNQTDSKLSLLRAMQTEEDGCPYPMKELTVKDVLKRCLSNNSLASEYESLGIDSKSTVAEYLASKYKLMKQKPEDLERLARLDESIEGVRTRVKNMSEEEVKGIGDEESEMKNKIKKPKAVDGKKNMKRTFPGALNCEVNKEEEEMRECMQERSWEQLNDGEHPAKHTDEKPMENQMNTESVEIKDVEKNSDNPDLGTRSKKTTSSNNNDDASRNSSDDDEKDSNDSNINNGPNDNKNNDGNASNSNIDKANQHSAPKPNRKRKKNVNSPNRRRKSNETEKKAANDEVNAISESHSIGSDNSASNAESPRNRKRQKLDNQRNETVSAACSSSSPNIAKITPKKDIILKSPNECTKQIKRRRVTHQNSTQPNKAPPKRVQNAEVRRKSQRLRKRIDTIHSS